MNQNEDDRPMTRQEISDLIDEARKQQKWVYLAVFLIPAYVIDLILWDMLFVSLLIAIGLVLSMLAKEASEWFYYKKIGFNKIDKLRCDIMYHEDRINKKISEHNELVRKKMGSD